MNPRMLSCSLECPSFNRTKFTRKRNISKIWVIFDELALFTEPRNSRFLENRITKLMNQNFATATSDDGIA